VPSRVPGFVEFVRIFYGLVVKNINFKPPEAMMPDTGHITMHEKHLN
jgi:hypothetical protein